MFPVHVQNIYCRVSRYSKAASAALAPAPAAITICLSCTSVTAACWSGPVYPVTFYRRVRSYRYSFCVYSQSFIGNRTGISLISLCSAATESPRDLHAARIFWYKAAPTLAVAPCRKILSKTVVKTIIRIS